MNQGRPSNLSQMQMQEKLQYYFSYNISERLVAEKINVNIKTVSKYFSQWRQEQAERQKIDYIKNDKARRAQIILALEQQILDGLDSLEDVKSRIQEFKTRNESPPNYLLPHKLDIQKYITSLIEKKGSFELQPPLNESLKGQIEQMVKEYVSG